jgi:hypothetical protein
MIFTKAHTLDDKVDKNLYPYETKEHKAIADTLNSYNIPFFYKQPMLVIENGKRMLEYADFFLPTYNGLAIDYIIESNSGVFRRKKNIYQDNQIPAIVIGKKDIRKPTWASQLYSKLQQVYHRNPVYRNRSKYG